MPYLIEQALIGVEKEIKAAIEGNYVKYTFYNHFEVGNLDKTAVIGFWCSFSLFIMLNKITLLFIERCWEDDYG